MPRYRITIETDDEHTLMVMQAMPPGFADAVTIDEIEDSDDTLRDFELFGYVGADEYGSGEIGIKQALVPAGMIPIIGIASHRPKFERPELVEHFAKQAKHFGVTIHYARFRYVETVRRFEP